MGVIVPHEYREEAGDHLRISRVAGGAAEHDRDAVPDKITVFFDRLGGIAALLQRVVGGSGEVADRVDQCAVEIEQHGFAV